MTTSNTGERNTGNCNTGHFNTGDFNTGNRNTGDCNTGYWNTGDCNTGDFNTGNRNTGDWNTGYWNTGDCNTGYCNTITPNILVFNKELSREEWDNADKPDWMYFSMTTWVYEQNMSDKEKEAYPSYTTTGGYLKVFSSYHHAAINSWEKATKEDKELTLKLPNFDVEVFKEIFGFAPEIKQTKTITIDEKDIEISQESFEQLKKSLT
jgi:hypothetical protein